MRMACKQGQKWENRSRCGTFCKACTAIMQEYCTQCKHTANAVYTRELAHRADHHRKKITEIFCQYQKKLYICTVNKEQRTMETAALTTATQGNTTVLTTEDKLQEVLKRFIADQDVKASSRNLYRRTLQQYLNWVQQQGYQMAEIDRKHILQYKEQLLADGKSSLTVGSYVSTVRLFYEWLEAQKIYPNVARGIHNPKRKQQYKKQPLMPQQVTELLSNEKQNHSTRDYALINLLVRTGLRTIEVSRANVEDITFKCGKRILMIKGKGRDEKDNWVELTDKAYLPLKKYLDERKAVGVEPLFTSTRTSTKGERITTRTISYIAKEALKQIGLDDKVYTAHSLRHTAAVNMLRAGGTMDQVQLALRHTNPATTQIYTATFNEERRLAASGESLLDRMY